MDDDKDYNYAGEVDSNNDSDFEDGADDVDDSVDADSENWEFNLPMPRMMSQTDRWAEAEAKRH